jgi:DNA-binding beta-propeller fold protein YncE
MVQLLLRRVSRNRLPGALFLAILILILAPALSARSKQKPQGPITVPQLNLEGGRKLVYERSFTSEREVKLKRSFWNKLVDIVAGAPVFHSLIRPYSVVTDSRDRIIVSDPGAKGVHIFDFVQQKYKFIFHPEGKDALQAPQCVAVDKQDNIYVTDSEVGKIFVFDSGGKLRHVIGSLKGGEGYFKRPTGIAVDSDAQRIFVTDTLRDKIYVMDMQGSILQTIGKRGDGNLEFNFPTEVRLDGQNLIVVDAMNFRVQVLDRSGTFKYAIGHLGDRYGDFFRPKGVAVDSEDHVYVVEGLNADVQVFDNQGRLLYYFGQKGVGPGEFQLPAGLFIDRNDRVFVADSYNRRVQVFRYFGLKKQAEGGGQ